MRLTFAADVPVPGIGQPDLSCDFGTLAAIPGEQGELEQVGRLLGVDVAPLQQVHERRQGAGSQPLPGLLACVRALQRGVERDPAALDRVAPFFLDGLYPRPEAFGRDLARLRAFLEALHEGGATTILITGGG